MDLALLNQMFVIINAIDIFYCKLVLYNIFLISDKEEYEKERLVLIALL